MALLAAVVGTCLAGVNPSSGGPARAVPHREPAFGAGGAPRRVPYAPPLKSVPAAAHRPAAQPALRDTATDAAKHWERTGWIKTGAIERHHFWLTRPFDHYWHDRAYFFRSRWWWWHHHHLWQLLWLGQGWAYWNGWYYGHWVTTQPSVADSETNTNTVADAGPTGSTAAAVQPSDLALRNQALNVLDGLQLSDNQLDVVHGALDHLSLAGEPVDADVINTTLDGKADCVAAINRLYADSAAGNEEQAAADLDQVYQLEDKYEVNFDPTVVVSDDARVQAKVIFDALTPRQIAQYLAVRGQVVPDPSQILVSALDQCRHLTDADFDEYTRCLQERLSVLVIGLDAAQANGVTRQVKALLREVRPLSDEDFASQKDDLQARAEQAVVCDPIDVIEHAVEWDLANFMANPQAKAMTDMRARQSQAPS
jgi:hypothetical protein